jgi:hypothetical protein
LGAFSKDQEQGYAAEDEHDPHIDRVGDFEIALAAIAAAAAQN